MTSRCGWTFFTDEPFVDMVMMSWCLQENSDYILYLRQSQQGILKEEERRYRFLAEKHCGLTQSLLFLVNKVGLTRPPTPGGREFSSQRDFLYLFQYFFYFFLCYMAPDFFLSLIVVASLNVWKWFQPIRVQQHLLQLVHSVIKNNKKKKITIKK